jgi:nucleoside-diphosphate-sugar epimerase
MRIAITGGSGRVGRGVVALALAQGHEVVNIDRVEPDDQGRPDIQTIKADITSYDELERALRGCDALVHLAAIASPGHHPDHVVHNNNVVASYNALRAAAELQINHVCQASSINAIGAVYSRWPRYDYFPVDEHHPTYNEDPYSLSKWVCEQQGDSFAWRYEGMTIASLRLHGVVLDRAQATKWGSRLGEMLAKQLWGYTLLEAAARACLLALTGTYTGHETFFVVAPDTMMDTPSRELAETFFPTTPIRGDLDGNRGFFDCAKAERLLGWKHE